MHPTELGGDAKEALRKAVRALREQLPERILSAAKGEYRLDVAPEKAQLPEARRERRARLEAWLDEQARGARGGKARKGNQGEGAASRQRFLGQAALEAAHTLLNRLILVRILEHHGVIAPAVVTGGWKSPAYEQEFIHYAGPLGGDDTRGYRALLDAVFAELSLDLPGLFGPVGLTDLFPVPAAVLHDVIDVLNDPALDSAWGDETTLGWVYQYWNDPERERLDKKISDRGKIEPHEIASKTQMFTERYMVEWLLQNSLGPVWLAICAKNGWTADAEAVIPVLEEKRAAWRKKREAGEVPLDALMPIAPGLESAWKYHVPQALPQVPQDAAARAPGSIRELKLLDPACGSGHFLVIAFGLLVDLYREEARHRGASWSDEEIAGWIVADNLHGIDIDPRAIQIAAAGLLLRARLLAPGARIERMNLVAPALRLGDLPEDDKALVALCVDLQREVEIPEFVTRKLVSDLAGVDYLGTLFRVRAAVRDAVEGAFEKLKEDIERGKAGQGDLFLGHAEKRATIEAMKETVLDKLTKFLAAHSTSEDLGLRLKGEQLASGARFVELVKEGVYDVVVGNPPYQGLSKTEQFGYVVTEYPRGKADLYAAFLERGLELVREGGLSAMVTMRGWMFLGQFAELRRHLLNDADLRGLADLGTGAFSSRSMDDVISTALVVARRSTPDGHAYSVKAAPLADPRRDAGKPARRNAALLAQEEVFEFDPKGFAVIGGEPIVYWWGDDNLALYRQFPLLGSALRVEAGVKTGSDVRFLRQWFEVDHRRLPPSRVEDPRAAWQFYIKGAAGAEWIEPASQVLNWERCGLSLKTFGMYQAPSTVRLRDPSLYFRIGVAFSPIGASFSARAHRTPSIFGNMGSSVFTTNVPGALCLLNSTRARKIAQALNPGLHFENDDVKRLPLFEIESADDIFATLDRAFTEHESHREPSVEFLAPGPSPWDAAQAWAQEAVDRPEGAPLPPYEPVHVAPEPAAHVSFALGRALGRFPLGGEASAAIPRGILFLSSASEQDGLAHPACAPLHEAWKVYGPALGGGDLKAYLRTRFFAYHKGLYESRPIHFPLSSEKKSFVAWVNIHRFADDTLQTLLADHLHPALGALDREMAELNASRASSDKKAAAAADKRYVAVKRLRDELSAFIDRVAQCAERGAPPTDPACPPRQVDAPFHLDLDDGVMIHSAALWPLLDPQWGDPKKWWKQLCQGEGRKDYDWAHLAQRYFPERVARKCVEDPSLAVAHGCFWRLHREKAYAWELRLQDEIRPDFTIDEADSDACRAAFLRDEAERARELVEAEEKRRERKALKAGVEEGEEEEAGGEEVGEDGEAG